MHIIFGCPVRDEKMVHLKYNNCICNYYTTIQNAVKEKLRGNHNCGSLVFSMQRYRAARGSDDLYCTVHASAVGLAVACLVMRPPKSDDISWNFRLALCVHSFFHSRHSKNTCSSVLFVDCKKFIQHFIN